ncbi:Hypothetical protein D9617_65g035080 [Elsinoe fawcettii]|nr:Hypothetical protein D9617_65g035080 [Elsinoe fawcettii]
MWDQLPKCATPELDIPRYLQLLFLLSIYIFKLEKVDVAIIEAHMGGKHDATNVVDNPYITAITPISLDHEEVLGPTLQDIAEHKAGIIKQGCPVLSSAQGAVVLKVISDKAIQAEAPLTIIQTDTTHHDGAKTTSQVQNETLAIAVTCLWLARTGIPLVQLDEIDLHNSTSKIRIPGRLQVVRYDRVDWYLDSAHNEESLSNTANWFCRASKENQPAESTDLFNEQDDLETFPSRDVGQGVRILVFAHSSKRDPFGLFDKLWQRLQSSGVTFTGVVITTYTQYKDKRGRNDRNLNTRGQSSLSSLVDHVKAAISPVSVQGLATIEEAVEYVKHLSQQGTGPKEVLVTGSIHLISGVVVQLERQGQEFVSSSM